MPKINSQDCIIHYEVTGNPDGISLIFSNSLGTNLHLWDGQVTAFQDKFRIIRYDTRGHGQSATPSEPFDMAILGQDVLAILDAENIDKACFCGISMGGTTGLWLAANAPDRFHRMIVANTGASFGPKDVWNNRIQLIQEHGIPSTTQSVMERWFTADFRQEAPEAVGRIAQMLEACDLDGYRLNCEAVRDFSFEDQLKDCRAPILVIAGEHDPATTPEMAKTIVSGVQNGQYLSLAAAHLSNIEAEAAFNNAIQSYLVNP